MAEILGLGMTHYPPLSGRDENMAGILERILKDPALPEHQRHPAGWPAPMREQYGADRGLAAARQHREELLAGFRKMRRVLDDFAPDFVVIWGDDQYENFREDIIPPFCLLAYDSITATPWAQHPRPNVWDEGKDAAFTYRGHPGAAKSLVSGLLETGFDVSY